jgi:RHS repeat-associated protein
LNEQIAYDLMGNITQLTRGGTGGGTLNYTAYTGNQLNTVTGYSPRTYAYDPNGNATTDGNTKAIQYNLLNLPQTVTQSGTTLATYTYDATGQKLRNSGSDGNWDYIGGIVYHNNTIAFIQTEEGRIANNSVQDHLGNNRVSIDAYNNTARVIQEDEYYSFGLRKPTGGYDLSNNNRYLYNGKEIQTDLANQYDYGARFYDPVIARWNVIDPKAEQMRRYSPYNFSFDNPIRFEDPDGMGPPFDFGFKFNLSLSFGTHSSPKLNFGASIGGSAKSSFGMAALNIAGNVSTGGLGFPSGGNGLAARAVVSPSLTLGTGSGASLPLNTFIGGSSTSVNNSFGASVSYGRNFTFSTNFDNHVSASAILKGGPVSFMTYNDAKSLGGPNTDQGYTGGGAFAVKLGGGVATVGNDVFTGRSDPNNRPLGGAEGTYGFDTPGPTSAGYAAQPFGDQLLNMGTTFAGFDSNGLYIGVSHSGGFDMFSQNAIHDLQSFHRFNSTTPNSLNVTVGTDK